MLTLTLLAIAALLVWIGANLTNLTTNSAIGVSETIKLRRTVGEELNQKIDSFQTQIEAFKRLLPRAKEKNAYIERKIKRAKQFRVTMRDNETWLAAPEGGMWSEWQVQRAVISLSVAGRVAHAGRSLSRADGKDDATVGGRRLTVNLESLSMNHGGHSPLAEDTIWIIDDDNRLARATLNTFEVVAISEVESQREMELDVLGAPGKEDSKLTAMWHKEWEQESFAKAIFRYFAADEVPFGAWASLTVGVPEPHFSTLFDDCVARRVDRIFVSGMLTAPSTGSVWSYDPARDMVLRGDGSLPISVRDVEVGCRLDAATPGEVEESDEISDEDFNAMMEDAEATEPGKG